MVSSDNQKIAPAVKYGVAFIFIAVLVIAGFFIFKPTQQSGSETEKQDRKSINIGVQINDSPGFSSMKDGQRNGFDIDLANYIANGLGLHPNFIPITIDSREQQLKQKYVDLAISTYSISDKRIGEGVIFAGPYMRTYQGIVVNDDNDMIKTIDDLAGKTICVTKGSTTADKLNEFKKNVSLVSTERDTFTQCLEDMKNPSTNVSAVTSDAVILQGHAYSDKTLKFIREIVIPGTYEKYGIGLSKDNAALCQKVSGLIKGFITTQWNAAFTANIQTDAGQDVKDLKPDPSTIDTEACRTN
jgi:glutamate transport system substrate-binding protein